MPEILAIEEIRNFDIPIVKSDHFHSWIEYEPDEYVIEIWRLK